MTADEAVIAAATRVWERYPLVLPVFIAFEFTDEVAALAQRFEAGTETRRHRARGKCLVASVGDGGARELGLPESVRVDVDGSSGEVEAA
jgi:hypothetical protein